MTSLATLALERDRVRDDMPVIEHGHGVLPAIHQATPGPRHSAGVLPFPARQVVPDGFLALLSLLSDSEHAPFRVEGELLRDAEPPRDPL